MNHVVFVKPGSAINLSCHGANGLFTKKSTGALKKKRKKLAFQEKSWLIMIFYVIKFINNLTKNI